VRGQGAEALPGLLAAARTMGFAGLNITYPCKQAVIPLLDDLSDEARRWARSTRWCSATAGHRPQHRRQGWRWGFERRCRVPTFRRVVLLGAGGAGSAIAHACCAWAQGNWSWWTATGPRPCAGRAPERALPRPVRRAAAAGRRGSLRWQAPPA
jgi:hypothetical protein